MTEFLKFKESQNIWSKINQSEHECISEGEIQRLEEIKLNGEFIGGDNLLKELEISRGEVYNRL